MGLSLSHEAGLSTETGDTVASLTPCQVGKLLNVVDCLWRKLFVCSTMRTYRRHTVSKVDPSYQLPPYPLAAWSSSFVIPSFSITRLSLAGNSAYFD